MMSDYQPGQDIRVRFDGLEHRGEVLHCERGWVTALVDIDPAGDYGSITARLAPRSVVCVRARFVSADDGAPPPE